MALKKRNTPSVQAFSVSSWASCEKKRWRISCKVLKSESGVGVSGLASISDSYPRTKQVTCQVGSVQAVNPSGHLIVGRDTETS